jgi:hypothetical protein
MDASFIAALSYGNSYPTRKLSSDPYDKPFAIDTQVLDDPGAIRITPQDFLEKPIVMVGPSFRHPVKLPAKVTTATSNTTKIEFELSSAHLADLTDAKIDFHLTLNGGTGATFKRMCNRVRNIFDRVVVRNHNGTYFDQRYNNRINSLLWSFTRKPSVDAQHGEFEGVGSPVKRDEWGAARKRYRCNLEIPIFQHQMWPARLVGPVTIELYLAPPNTVIETNGTNPSYELDSIELAFDEVQVGQDYYNDLLSKGMLFRPYVNVAIVDEPVHGQGGDYNVSIQKSDMRAIGVVTKADDWNLPYVLDKFETFPYASPDGAKPKTARIRIGTTYYPQTDLKLGGGSSTETVAEPYRLFNQFAEQFRGLDSPASLFDDIPVDSVNYQKDKFMFVIPMRSTGENGRIEVIGSSSTRNLGGQPITINFMWDTAPSTALKHYFWCFYSEVLVIDLSNKAFVTFS